MSNQVPLTEQIILNMESRIPELASGAFKRAYYQALTRSGKVLEAVDGALVETTADGSQRIIRPLPKSIPVAIGTRRTRAKA